MRFTAYRLRSKSNEEAILATIYLEYINSVVDDLRYSCEGRTFSPRSIYFHVSDRSGDNKSAVLHIYNQSIQINYFDLRYGVFTLSNREMEKLYNALLVLFKYRVEPYTFVRPSLPIITEPFLALRYNDTSGRVVTCHLSHWNAVDEDSGYNGSLGLLQYIRGFRAGGTLYDSPAQLVLGSNTQITGWVLGDIPCLKLRSLDSKEYLTQSAVETIYSLLEDSIEIEITHNR